MENIKLQNFAFWLPEQIITERFKDIRFFYFLTLTVENKPEVKVTPCNKEYKLFFRLFGVVSLVLYAVCDLN